MADICPHLEIGRLRGMVETDELMEMVNNDKSEVA